MRLSRDGIRSPRGQLALLAGAYAGALVLAVVALALRSAFFESFVREKHPPLPEGLKGKVERLRAGEGPGQVTPEEAADLYGAWIDDPALDPEGRVPRALLSGGPSGMSASALSAAVRRTLAAGSAAQRLRALGFLAGAAHPALRDEALRLARSLTEHARRRGEREIVVRGEAVLREIQGSQP
ncbi:MAG: hypothetical protein HY721_30820 [Planctomycetes bacterium]|nr:hypothetical protein [Planctomycetota bacterium]